jgi:hypothetical protein
MLKFLNVQNVQNLNVSNHLEVKNKMNQNVLIKAVNKHYNFKDMYHFVIVQVMRSFYQQC